MDIMACAFGLSPFSGSRYLRLASFCRIFAVMSSSRPQSHHPRRSHCADASLKAEIDRVSKMTIEERVKAALSMNKRFSWVKQATKQD